jgi:aminoglycoside 6'-N-acetyltransferase
VTVERISDGFLSWRLLIAGDLPMLAEWLREPQVARWWNHETTLEAVERDFGASTRGEEPGEDLLVLLDGRPIGLLQRSAICDYPQDLTKFSAVIEVPVGAVELDYLIADPALRGRGLGSRMIAAAVEDTWNSYSDAPAVLVAVVAANVASWRALEKAGLKRVAEGPMSPDNPIDDVLHYIYRVDRPGAASSALGVTRTNESPARTDLGATNFAVGKRMYSLSTWSCPSSSQAQIPGERRPGQGSAQPTRRAPQAALMLLSPSRQARAFQHARRCAGTGRGRDGVAAGGPRAILRY